MSGIRYRSRAYLPHDWVPMPGDLIQRNCHGHRGDALDLFNLPATTRSSLQGAFTPDVASFGFTRAATIPQIMTGSSPPETTQTD